MATTKKQINQHNQIKQQINSLYWTLKNSSNAHPKFIKEVKDAIAALEKILPYF